jgi:hypothetical protein
VRAVVGVLLLVAIAYYVVRAAWVSRYWWHLLTDVIKASRSDTGDPSWRLAALVRTSQAEMLRHPFRRPRRFSPDEYFAGRATNGVCPFGC